MLTINSFKFFIYKIINNINIYYNFNIPEIEFLINTIYKYISNIRLNSQIHNDIFDENKIINNILCFFILINPSTYGGIFAKNIQNILYTSVLNSNSDNIHDLIINTYSYYIEINNKILKENEIQYLYNNVNIEINALRNTLYNFIIDEQININDTFDKFLQEIILVDIEQYKYYPYNNNIIIYDGNGELMLYNINFNKLIKTLLSINNNIVINDVLYYIDINNRCKLIDRFRIEMRVIIYNM